MGERITMKPNDPTPEESSIMETAAALTHLGRVRILKELYRAGDWLAVGHLSEVSGMGQSQTSQHLKRLEEVGLVVKDESQRPSIPRRAQRTRLMSRIIWPLAGAPEGEGDGESNAA